VGFRLNPWLDGRIHTNAWHVGEMLPCALECNVGPDVFSLPAILFHSASVSMVCLWHTANAQSWNTWKFCSIIANEDNLMWILYTVPM
jgi:hypothetical protein